MKKILFVCSGNTCRSPMAEAIFNHIEKNKEFSALSCGLYGDGISAISENTKAALNERGIDFTHISTPISKKLISEADFVIGMTANHARNIISQFPEYKDKIYSMPVDICDPYGGDINVYRNCRNEIEDCINILIKAIKGENNG